MSGLPLCDLSGNLISVAVLRSYAQKLTEIIQNKYLSPIGGPIQFWVFLNYYNNLMRLQI